MSVNLITKKGKISLDEESVAVFPFKPDKLKAAGNSSLMSKCFTASLFLKHEHCIIEYVDLLISWIYMSFVFGFVVHIYILNSTSDFSTFDSWRLYSTVHLTNNFGNLKLAVIYNKTYDFSFVSSVTNKNH